MTRLACMFLLVAQCHSATWYVATNGTGTSTNIGSPGELVATLRTNAISGGDTIYLRGGTYHGRLKSTLVGQTNNPITIQSYPGEWAILDDNFYCVLGEDIGTGDGQFTITNIAETVRRGWGSILVESGDTNRQEGLYILSVVSANVANILRGQVNFDAAHITNHPAGTVGWPGNGILAFTSASNIVVQSIGIVGVSTNRDNYFVKPGGISVDGSCYAISFVGVEVHNAGTGIGHSSMQGSRVDGCLIRNNGIMDTLEYLTPTRRGQGMYLQSGTQETATIRATISYDNYTGGGKGYGAVAGAIDGMEWIGNMMISQKDYTLYLAGNGGPVSSLTVSSNVLMCLLTNTATAATRINETSYTNTNLRFDNNILFGGDGAWIDNTKSGVFTNNTVFIPATLLNASDIAYFVCRVATTAEMGWTWDYNQFLIGGSDAYGGVYSFVTDSQTNAMLSFSEWKTASGWDSHSTETRNGWGTSYQSVRVSRPTGLSRWHIAIVNTTTNTAYAFTPSDYGLTTGHAYRLQDAQNATLDPTDSSKTILSGVYSSGTISLPLNGTNYATFTGSVPAGYVMAHSNTRYPGFVNMFILDDLGMASTARATAAGRVTMSGRVTMQ